MPLFNRQNMSIKGATTELLLQKSAKSILIEATKSYSGYQEYDVFFSHSYKDGAVILGITETIKELGFSVYVDWLEDTLLDRTNVTAMTAHRLRERMRNCLCLFFAVSENSLGSIWTAWELGFFDGIKGKVAVLPIAETAAQSESYRGQEYLGLYYYITITPDRSGRQTLWVNETATKYVMLRAWLNGQVPVEHK